LDQPFSWGNRNFQFLVSRNFKCTVAFDGDAAFYVLAIGIPHRDLGNGTVSDWNESKVAGCSGVARDSKPVTAIAVLSL
jgi:hypothetical protein